MNPFTRHILSAGMPVSEYSTVTVPGEILEKVQLEMNGQTMDISGRHWLLGLKPVVFGIWFSGEVTFLPSEKDRSFCLIFKDSEKQNRTTAKIRLDYFDEIQDSGGTLLLLKLSVASVFHIHPLRVRYLYYRHYKKPEQNFDILKSFAAAYSYPRRVRLISFSDNLFPMDLVGEMSGDKRYVFGLRHTNVSLPGILATRKLVVAELSFAYKKLIYMLGGQHRKPFRDFPVQIPFLQSELFGFPVPEWVDSYKEIKILETMNLGSHMLLWGEEVNEKILRNSTEHLFHVHFLHYLHQKKWGNAYALV